MTRKTGTTRRKDDLNGQLALMLSEALLHVLVEKRVITTEIALEAVDTVADLIRERPQRGARTKGLWPSHGSREAMAIIETMRASFAAKS